MKNVQNVVHVRLLSRNLYVVAAKWLRIVRRIVRKKIGMFIERHAKARRTLLQTNKIRMSVDVAFADSLAPEAFRSLKQDAVHMSKKTFLNVLINRYFKFNFIGGNWICNDQHLYEMMSFRLTSCLRNHWRYSRCGAHDSFGHSGSWKTCTECTEPDAHDFATVKWYGFCEKQFNFDNVDEKAMKRNRELKIDGSTAHLVMYTKK
jgi:hypothetical protein